MSLTEILDQVEQLSPSERRQLGQRLALLELAEDSAHQDEVERRFAAMKAGQFLTEEELRERLDKLRGPAAAP
ncbi:MAG: hypothetical protein QOE70_5163 [Chthoniobacter sp.]|jgi:predicted transcriptional regulator|nr:hypothetical protein [Chthoniobacter sp.]